MLKALILSTTILGTWPAAGTVRTPAHTPPAPVGVLAFVNTQTTAPQPGTRGPVIQL